MKRHIIMAALLCAALSVLVFALANRRAGSSQQNRPDIRSQSLRELAKRKGTTTATARPTNLRKYDDVRSLTHESNDVIVASVESKSSYLLPPAEKLVVTDFAVRVLDVLKGGLRPAQTITVRGPGGRVDLPDGTSVEVKMPDFWKNPEIGKSYVFFLERRNSGYLVLRGGPQGLFEIANGSVKPQVRPEDKLMQNYDGTSLVSFLEEIRRVSR